MSFPSRRLRRLRTSENERISPTDYILQKISFVSVCSRGSKTELSRIYVRNGETPIDDINDEVGTISDLGIPAIMLFGIPTKKDDAGSSAFDDIGIVQKQLLRSGKFWR